MAFTNATVLRFEKTRGLPPDNVVTSVFVAVHIHDDAFLTPKYAEFYCKEDELLALQSITDISLKRQASVDWLRAKVANAHAAWLQDVAIEKPRIEILDSAMLVAAFGVSGIA